jgi:hypothetical protein
MDRIKQIFTELGVPDESIETFLNPEAEIDTSEFLGTIKSNAFNDVFSQKKGELEKTIGDTHVNGFKNKVIRDLNKSLNLGYTNSELEKNFKYEDFLDHVREQVDTKVKSTATEEKQGLISQINTYKTQLASIQDEYEGKIRSIVEEKENEVKLFKIDKILSEEYQKREFDSPQKAVLYTEKMTSELPKLYTISDDGSVLAKDGTAAVDPFKKNKTISHISEAINSYIEHYGMGKKNNANPSASVGTNGLPPTTTSKGEYTGNAAKLLQSVGLK